MKSSNFITSSPKYNFLLVLLTLVGTVFILFPTSRYGAVLLSSDAIRYIGTARNIIAGEGVTSYEGIPLVVQPPLYSTLLAFVGKISGIDPLRFTHIINALLFGFTIYLGGLLIFKYFSAFPGIAIVGVLTIALGRPLLYVSTTALSEPLFIFTVILSFTFAYAYLEKRDLTSLVLFSFAVALSSLTRYIGIILIFWGGLSIIIFNRENLNRKLRHLALFTFISALPIGLWLIRNYEVSGTLLGLRVSTIFSLSQNITFTLYIFLKWSAPILPMAAVVFLATDTSQETGGDPKAGLRQIAPINLFMFMYTTFLIISSTRVAYDKIDDRLLSPVYIPLALFLITLTQALLPYRKRLSELMIKPLLIISVLISLAYLLLLCYESVNLYRNGRGYSSKEWRESPTIQFLIQHRTLASECTFYSNVHEATYILADFKTKILPIKTKYNSTIVINTISNLKGWPPENKSCLVYFQKAEYKENLFTMNELQEIVNFKLIARLEDGAVYSITRK